MSSQRAGICFWTDSVGMEIGRIGLENTVSAPSGPWRNPLPSTRGGEINVKSGVFLALACRKKDLWRSPGTF